MKNENEFKDFNEAYKELISDILTYGRWVDGVQDPNSIGSEFGRKIRRTKELIVYTFIVLDPRSRTLPFHYRKIRKEYLLANFLWALLGTKEGKEIILFNENGKPFLDEHHEFNSAIGPHIFKIQHDTYHDLNEIENLLRRDPASRRAVFQFFSQTDINSNARDVPCYNHMQFFIRDGSLQSHVVMRSQNALTVLPYDFYLFSLLHEALSVRLNIKLGKLYYTSNSLHIYEDNINTLDESIKSLDKMEHLVMQDFSDSTIAELKRVFIKIAEIYQTKKLHQIEELINDSKLDHYWSKLLKVHFLEQK